MGLCGSKKATAFPNTGKLILPDGSLKEYNETVRVSQILQNESEDVFICNGDDLRFGGYVTSVGTNEFLCPGQIFFLLPKSMLNQRLPKEEMSRLAVRAVSSLAKNSAVAATSSHSERRGKKVKVKPVEERRKFRGSRLA